MKGAHCKRSQNNEMPLAYGKNPLFVIFNEFYISLLFSVFVFSFFPLFGKTKIYVVALSCDSHFVQITNSRSR